uniref:non-specific serine/threonine protein kinase n=1 Tax=Oryzias latipes TaxID=8090 RepID=A0A3B3II01_ORYLA
RVQSKKKNRSFCHGRHPGKVLDVQPLPGQGGFGKVCCEVDGTSKPLEAVALEMVSKDPPFPGIIRMLDFYKTRGAWVIITEKPENTQDLFDYITTCKLLREDTAREFLGQVIQALLHCHSRGVVHMDVKDENLLLDLSTRKLLLIDFGSAVFLKPDKEYDTFDGTATYAPPERLTRGCYKALPSEVWSLRILLYDMVSTPEERPTLKDILAHTWMLKRGSEVHEGDVTLMTRSSRSPQHQQSGVRNETVRRTLMLPYSKMKRKKKRNSVLEKSAEVSDFKYPK